MSALITAEIAGYSFEGDNKCPACTAAWARLALMVEGCWQTSGKSTEELLSLLAALWDVDRDSADPEDYPVPFSGQTALTAASMAVHDNDPTPRCNCGDNFMGEF